MIRKAVIAGLLTLALLPATHNGSTDGRYHTCGYVTEDGVTDHLRDYWARCGRMP